MNIKNSRIPTIFVVLGVTGDLTAKKIVPALFSLHEKKMLPPNFEFVGVSRRDWTDADLKDHVRAILHVKAPHASEAQIDSFLEFVTYGKIRFDALDDYVGLNNQLRAIDDRWGMCTNKLFYLSVPPTFYDEIFENLHKSHLTDPCGPDEGWTRIVVEKPFGSDEKSARQLDAHLAKLFKEDQIYRIDHYLAKETFQNILAFRFFNNLFEDQWGNELIEKISIRELENVGAEDRGSFYESVGALRDVGQNHLLQMLALITMEEPRDLSANAIRSNRAKILEMIKPMSPVDIKTQTFRAQYDGYRTIKGVAPDSNIETYFQVRAELLHPRWAGVPILMEAGKRLAKPSEDETTEIEVLLKHPSPCLCASYHAATRESELMKGERDPKTGNTETHFKDRIVFRQDPKENITIHFWAKKPGFDFILEERAFEFDLRTVARKTQYTEEYEKLLLDCIMGDQTLFVSSPEIAAMWRFADPIEKAWAKNAVPLRNYAPDSPAISAQATILLDGSAASARNGAEMASGFMTGSRDARGGLKYQQIGLYGLGKMGAGLAKNFREKGWRVVVANRSVEPIEKFEADGFEGARSLGELLEKLSGEHQGGKAIGKSSEPRIIWLMVTAGRPVDDLLFGKKEIGKRAKKSGVKLGTFDQNDAGGLVAKLRKGDIVIDGGNSFFEDSQRRARLLAKKGIRFLDVGVSGGPAGARNGACMMVGGDKKAFEMLEGLIKASCVSNGYAYFGAAGSGHYVKMVHNGIEYGMMQSIAEGFALMKKSPYKLDLEKIAHLYNNGSVIESRLIGWMESGFQKFGQDLKAVSGTVAYTGEGEWTIKTAKKIKMKLPAIEDAFKFRVKSKRAPSYTGKILSTLRNQFGGHATEMDKSK